MVTFQPKPFGPIAVVGDTGQLVCMLKEPDTRFRRGAGARWSIMIISLGVTASSFLFINGVAFLIPSLEARRGIPLTEASLLASMPSWGMVVTLVLWGYVLDRVGDLIEHVGAGNVEFCGKRNCNCSDAGDVGGAAFGCDATEPTADG